MRNSGILLHISSLPSPYGIGTLGRQAMQFIDFLKGAKQSYWQILPLGPTSYGDSPYQSFSTFAGNPYFVDPDILCEQGLLEKEQLRGMQWGHHAEKVDYNALYSNRFGLLRKAHRKFLTGEHPGYISFCESQRSWLDNYALFMAIKRLHGDSSWLSWPQEFRERERLAMEEFLERHIEEVDFWRFVQYMFHLQWSAIKKYATQNGIQIIGDLPIYVALDSADVWSNPGLFLLDEDMRPSVIAGTPPDAFSDTGQLWGNPVYDWVAHKKDGYSWWIERLKRQTELYNVLRLDHFLGFETYFTIPRGDVDATGGKWNQGPGLAFFEAVQKSLGQLDIIAEDLGVITEQVIALRESLGYPGMRILQFAFSDANPDSEHMPHHISANNIVYTGTHDNPSIKEWWRNLDRKHRRYTLRYMGLTSSYQIADRIMNLAMASRAVLCILCLQDLLGLGRESRINHPGVISGNWQWRLKSGKLNRALMQRLAAKTRMYGRIREQKGIRSKKMDDTESSGKDSR